MTCKIIIAHRICSNEFHGDYECFFRWATETEYLEDSLAEGISSMDGGMIWWAMRDSNSRHPRCKRGALPAELIALRIMPFNIINQPVQGIALCKTDRECKWKDLFFLKTETKLLCLDFITGCTLIFLGFQYSWLDIDERTA